MRLADGRYPHVDPTSAARSGDATLVLGSPTLVWPGNAVQRTLPDDSTAVGVILSAERGGTTLVKRPPIAGYLRQSRAAARPGGGWDVLFFAGKWPDDWKDTHPDSVVAYATSYLRGRWGRVTRVADITNAKIRHEFASALVRRHGSEIGFSYPLGANLAPLPREPQGIVFLHTVNGRWHADTIFTSRRVAYVAMVAGVDSVSWTMLFQMTDDSGANLAPGSLSLTLWSGVRWTPPRLVVRSALNSLDQPGLYRVSQQLYASWTQVERLPGKRNGRTALHWARLSQDSVLDARNAAYVALEAEESHAVQLEPGHVVWTLRDFANSSSVRLHAARQSGIDSLRACRSRIR